MAHLAPTLRMQSPSPALAPFVEVLWRCVTPDPPAGRERHLPSAAPQLLINLAEDALSWSDGPSLDRTHRLDGAAISGPFDAPIGLDLRDQRHIVGAVLRPGAARALLDAPLDHFARTHVALADLPGFAALRARLLDAPAERALPLLEAWLLGRLNQARRDRAMQWACSALDRGVSVSSVADRLGMSPRTLRRRFIAATGLAPKRYGCLARFQRAARRIAAEPVRGWAELALELGYFDQAHFVREFRAFSGLTPTAFAPRSAVEYNHVAEPEGAR